MASSTLADAVADQSRPPDHGWKWTGSCCKAARPLERGGHIHAPPRARARCGGNSEEHNGGGLPAPNTRVGILGLAGREANATAAGPSPCVSRSQ